MTLHTAARLLGASLLTAFTWGGAHAQAPTPEQSVDALKGVFGAHPGARASHAKGVCAAGTFLPNANAKAITTAPFLQREATPMIGRFSVGGGNPKASDKGKSVRGLAVRFDAGSASPTDLVMISAPVFFVSKAEHFIPFLEARRPDPATGKPDGARVKAFNEAHPDTKPQIDYLASAPVPASYGSAPYWAVNAFRFTNAHGNTVHGRWRAEPVAGRQGLSEEQLKSLPDDFLAGELEHRLKKAPVEFDLWVQVAGPGDALNDPTVQWPADRPEHNVGRLRFDKFEAQACDQVMFNPVSLPKGIAPSDDSTLLMRLPAYGVSLSRRMGN